MLELIQNASLGYEAMNAAGKIMCLFLASLLFFWFSEKKEGILLFRYATFVGAACMIPVTGALLMLYQTKFYDYEWVFSLVPVTAVIGCGVVWLLWSGKKEKTAYFWGIFAALLLLIFFAGGMGKTSSELTNIRLEEQERIILEEIRNRSKEQEICLWAPSSFLERAMEEENGITLLYGRNMWDIWLNAYSFDTYSEELKELYSFMEGETKPTGKSEVFLKKAVELGANMILIPKEIYEGSSKECRDSFQEIWYGEYCLLVKEPLG